MSLRWCDQIVLHPELQNIENWPTINLQGLDSPTRRKYLRNRRIVAGVLDNKPYAEIAKRNNVTKGRISQLMQRCLQPCNDNGDLPLSKGMLPGLHIKESPSDSKLNSLSDNAGHRGQFKALLKKYPNIEKKLTAFLDNKLRDRPDAHTIKPRWFHAEFKRILEENKLPKNRYPFNTDSVAYSSVCRLLRRLLAKRYLNQLPKSRIETMIPKLQNRKALRVIEIDEQLTDIQCSFHLELHDGLMPLRLARVAVIVAIDSDTQCILAFHLCLTGSPSQEDMLCLLEKLTVKSQNDYIISTPGIEILPDAEIPALIQENGNLLVPDIVKLDNALIHIAKSVTSTFLNCLGSTLHFGPAGQPVVRHQVEQAMQVINEATHRFASTTGSSVVDPIRESSKLSKTPPSLNIKTLEDALFAVCANHNARLKGHLGGASPLKVFYHQLENLWFRALPKEHVKNMSPFVFDQEVPVKFYPNENRAPFINFAHLRYSGKCLSIFDVLEKNIRIRINRQDVRKVQAFDCGGNYLGDLYAPKSWLHFPHSLKLRQLIMKLVKKDSLSTKDPLIGYANLVIGKKERPKYALQLYSLLQALERSNNDSMETEERTVSRNSQDHKWTCPSDTDVFDSWDDTWVMSHEI